MSKQISNETDSELSTNTSVIRSKRRIAQNYLLIWVDTNIDESTEDYQNTITKLQSVVSDINTFTKLDEAVDFLTEVSETKVFLIADGSIDQQVISLIHDIQQLDSVYIFCNMQKSSI